MGQKTNPSIFRLTKTSDWKSKYIEKKSTEFYLYTSKDVEIRKFLHKFFKDNGLTLHNCSINHSNELFNLFITYQQNLDSLSLITNINKLHSVKLVKKKQKILKKYSNILRNISHYYEYESLQYKQLLKIKQHNIISKRKTLQMKRVKSLNYYKKYLRLKTQNKLFYIRANSFINKLFEGISMFLDKNVKMTLILQPLQKNTKTIITKTQHNLLKKKLVSLRKYRRNEFFKEGVNLAFSCVNNEKSSELISNFISTNFRKLKRHNFFLKFIKSILTVFVLKTFSSKISGIKIKVKGRFNGAPRAKHKIINIGRNMPVLALNSKIDYAETTAYTINGTFGVKVWVCGI
jgi:ribosomal protein S3